MRENDARLIGKRKSGKSRNPKRTCDLCGLLWPEIMLTHSERQSQDTSRQDTFGDGGLWAPVGTGTRAPQGEPGNTRGNGRHNPLTGELLYESLPGSWLHRLQRHPAGPPIFTYISYGELVEMGEGLGLLHSRDLLGKTFNKSIQFVHNSPAMQSA